jgi:hypothetical protein
MRIEIVLLMMLSSTAVAFVRQFMLAQGRG